MRKGSLEQYLEEKVDQNIEKKLDEHLVGTNNWMTWSNIGKLMSMLGSR